MVSISIWILLMCYGIFVFVNHAGGTHLNGKSAWDWHGEAMARNNHLAKGECVKKAMLPGMCWGCKWILKNVKKTISESSTQKEIARKLQTACDKIGFLKSSCKSFLNKCLSTLVEELSTIDDVTTICVNVKACK